MFFSQKQWLFDLWAPSYDWLFPTVFYQAVHKRLLDYVNLPEHPQVLDLGCGTGQLLNRLAATFPTLRGTGLDLSPQMLYRARQNNRHHPRLIYIQGNAEMLPFAELQFDAVFSTLSFLHYPHPQQVFAEISRVLRPKGHFYLVDISVGQACSRIDTFAVGSIQFYSRLAREQLGQTVGLNCEGNFSLLGPVLLSRFAKV